MAESAPEIDLPDLDPLTVDELTELHRRYGWWAQDSRQRFADTRQHLFAERYHAYRANADQVADEIASRS